MRKAHRSINFVLIGVAMAALIVVISLQVFFRYALNNPLAWPEEAGRYLFIWIVFLGIPEAYRDGKHLGMDLFVLRLPLGARTILARVVELIVVAIAAAAAWYSIDLVRLTMKQTAPVLKIPVGFVYVAFTIGFTLVVVETLIGWFRPRGERSPGEHLYGLDPSTGRAGASARPSVS